MSRITFAIIWPSLMIVVYFAHSTWCWLKLRRQLDRMIENIDAREAARQERDAARAAREEKNR
jgi:hypothetical protein